MALSLKPSSELGRDLERSREGLRFLVSMYSSKSDILPPLPGWRVLC